jgi:hypothetical protein
MASDIVCLQCGSSNYVLLGEGLGKCKECGLYFDGEEISIKFEKIPRKKPKEEDELEDEV